MKKLIVIVITFFCSFFCESVYAIDEEILIIFDASVSMLDGFSGKAKYITAIEETKKALDKLSDSNYIGLRTIGVTIDNSILSIIQNPDMLCKSTQLLAPIKTGNINVIKNQLNSIFPLGTTPLTYTLDLAINFDFTKSALIKHIILVTDGAESCSGNPCEYIKKITMNRNDIKIDIIAINVNADDFKQLKCLADFSSGNIYQIKNPNEIESAYNNIFTPDIKTDVINSYNSPNNKKESTIYKNYLIETCY